MPDEDGGTRQGRRSIVYSLVPRGMPSALLARVRRALAREEHVRVIVERRVRDRRNRDRRDHAPGDGPPDERRRVRNPHGRRIGERRAPLVPIAAPQRLRHALGEWADRLRFVEHHPLEPQTAEDRDTARLVVRLQAGDPGAFDEIYERYVARVYGYVQVALRDEHEAQDVTHEIFLSVLQALPAYRLSGAPFRTWLFRIARNQVINHTRKHRRVEVMESDQIARRLEGGPFASESEALRRTADSDLLQLVQTLPIAQRQVLVLRYAMGFDVNEIAEILDRSPNAVSQIQQRAFNTLRARLLATGRRQRASDPGGERLDMRRRASASRVTVARRLALTY